MSTSKRILISGLVPKQFAGKWVAWTLDGRYPLGAGDTPEAARQAADDHGAHAARGWRAGMAVAYEWVPPADERFVGNTPL